MAPDGPLPAPPALPPDHPLAGRPLEHHCGPLAAHRLLQSGDLPGQPRLPSGSIELRSAPLSDFSVSVGPVRSVIVAMADYGPLAGSGEELDGGCARLSAVG